MTARDEERGSAPERTSLAWRRTALAFAVNAALLIRSGNPWVQGAACLALAIAAGLAFAGRQWRAEALVAIAAAFSALDLIAITR